MARVLLSGNPGLGAKTLLLSLRAAVKAAGHDPDPAALADADAVVVVLDGPAAAAPAVACAQAKERGKPLLVLHTGPAEAELLALATQGRQVATVEEIGAAVAPFLTAVRPYSGRIVRDLVPRLAREAGHTLQVREAVGDERVRHLKRKVSEEASALLAADATNEKEVLADLLEAVEALIRERGHGRDDLKLVKQARLKRRGGFERCLVVESAIPAGVEGAPAASPALNVPAAPANGSA